MPTKGGEAHFPPYPPMLLRELQDNWGLQDHCIPQLLDLSKNTNRILIE